MSKTRKYRQNYTSITRISLIVLDQNAHSGYNRGMDSRKEIILNILEKEGRASLSALAERLFVSESTIRRYVAALEKEGLLLRSHGKAMAVKSSADGNASLNERFGRALGVKRELARAAAEHELKPNSVIMLDASTTAMQLVPFIKHCEGVIVITTGVMTACRLTEANVRFVLSGGSSINESYSLVGQSAIDTVSLYNADVCFVSCHGVSPDGFATDTSAPENEVRLALMRRSKRRILLIDDSKLEQAFWHNLCPVCDFDAVYCNAPLPEALARQVKSFVLVK